jgi:hypothetical protein
MTCPCSHAHHHECLWCPWYPPRVPLRRRLELRLLGLIQRVTRRLP